MQAKYISLQLSFRKNKITPTTYDHIADHDCEVFYSFLKHSSNWGLTSTLTTTPSSAEALQWVDMGARGREAELKVPVWLAQAAQTDHKEMLFKSEGG